MSDTEHYVPHVNSLGLCQCGCRECKFSLLQSCKCDDCPCEDPADEDSHMVDLRSGGSASDVEWHTVMHTWTTDGEMRTFINGVEWRPDVVDAPPTDAASPDPS